MGKSAAVRLADGNNGLIAHSVFWTEPDDGRFGRIVDGRRPEHEVGLVEPIGQTAAGNQNPLERRDEVRRLRIVGGVHGGIEKTLSLRLRREEPEPRNLIDGIRIARIGRVEPERSDRSGPVLMVELAHVDNRGPPGIVPDDGKRGVTLVRKNGQRIGRKEQACLRDRRLVFVPNGEERSLVGGERVVRAHRNGQGEVGSGRNQLRQPDFVVELPLPERNQLRVRSVVENPDRLAREQGAGRHDD